MASGAAPTRGAAASPPGQVPLWPTLEPAQGRCSGCGVPVPTRLVVQGIHVAQRHQCPHCGADRVRDLPTGHALLAPFDYDVRAGTMRGDAASERWFAAPFLDGLRNPSPEPVELRIERRTSRPNAVLLDCLDYLYGHALLKLLDAESLRDGDRAVVVLVQPFLRWLVPEWVDEVWVAHLPLGQARRYFADLDAKVQTEFARFESVALAPARSHPRVRDLAAFTKVKPRHPLQRSGAPCVTVAWREDRLWAPDLPGDPWRRPALARLGRAIQRHRVLRLLTALRKAWPAARLQVAGLGRTGAFPPWVHDLRVERFDDAAERRLAQAYADSDLVVGVHGSSMLLPSGLAAQSLHLTPEDRWGNLFQDTLVLEGDARLAQHRNRYLPLATSPRLVAKAAISQVDEIRAFYERLSP